MTPLRSLPLLPQVGGEPLRGVNHRRDRRTVKSLAYRSSEKQNTQPPSYSNKSRPYSVAEEALIVSTINNGDGDDVRKTFRHRHDELVDHGRIALAAAAATAAAAASFDGEIDTLEWPPCKLVKKLESVELVRKKPSQSERESTISHTDEPSSWHRLPSETIDSNSGVASDIDTKTRRTKVTLSTRTQKHRAARRRERTTQYEKHRTSNVRRREKQQPPPPSSSWYGGRVVRRSSRYKVLSRHEETELINKYKAYSNLRDQIAETCRKHDECNSIEAALQRLRVTVSNWRVVEKEGLDAWERLVLSNIGLVVWVVSRRGLLKCNGLVDTEDLVNEGMLGLMKALKRFDSTRSTRLSTYATWYIWRYVHVASFRNCRGLRLPENVYRNMVKQQGESDGAMLSKKSKENEEEEEEDETKMKKKKSKNKKDQKIDFHYLPDRTLSSLESGQSALSLERLLENEIEIHDLDGTSIISSLSQSTCLDSSNHKPFEYVKESEFLSEFQCVLESILSDEEIAILRHRYGFISGKRMTISACARALQVSRSKVERRLKRCFNRIRVSPKALELWKEYACLSNEIDLQ